MNIPRKWAREAVILFAIILVALALRLTTFKYPYLMAYDPFHHYKIAEYIAQGNRFPEVWHLSQYPNGARISEPMGLYYVSVLLYKISKVFGMSFFSAFKLSTPIFGALTIVPAYLLAKEVFNRRTAFFSAVILAFLPAFAYRTFSGFYRGDGFSVFFMVLGFYLFLKSLELEIRKSIALALAAGLCFGFMGLVWNGFMFGFVVLSGFAVLYSLVTYLQGKKSRVLLSYAISAGLGIALIKYSVMVQPHAQGFIRDLIRYVYPSTLIFSGLLEGIKYKTAHLEMKVRAAPLALIALASPIVVYKLASEVVRNLLTGYGLVKAARVFTQTIGELQPPSLEVLWGKYSILSNLVDFSSLPMPGVLTLLLVLFPLGLLFLARDLYRWNWKALFFGMWALASLFLFKTALRYAFLASIPLAILGALFLVRTEEKLSNKRLLHLLPLSVILLVAVNGVTYASQQRPHMTPEWYEALNFLKTQEEGGVMTWWDYGSWIQGIAGFPTTMDTVHGQHVGRVKEVGRALLETNESNTLDTLRRYHVDYILIPVDMIGQMTNVDAILNISRGDYQYPILGRSGSVRINNIPAEVYGSFYVFNMGGDRLVTYKKGERLHALKRVYWREGGRLFAREYVNLSLPSVEGAAYISKGDLSISQLPLRDFMVYIPPRLEKTLLTSLMLLEGMGSEHQKLIYSNSQVRIYKSIYDHTRIGRLETDKLNYKTGENISINVEIESTKLFVGRLEVKIFNPEDAVVFYGDYEVNEKSSLNIPFVPPSDSVLGGYRVVADLYGSGRIDSLRRVFKISGRQKEEIQIEAKIGENSSTKKLVILGKASEKGKPLANQDIIISQGKESWQIKTNEHGGFSIVIENPKLFRGSTGLSIYTSDYRGSKTAYATAQAQIIEDFKLSKYEVKRGEKVDISFVVKNTGNLILDGFLSINSISSAKTNIFTEDPNMPYLLNPGEAARFEHIHTVREDAPIGKFKIWREMRENNLKVWMSPKNKEGEGTTAEVTILE
jgi:dolichyl-diphosphooligosaccharide--protein glycosyltransferase